MRALLTIILVIPFYLGFIHKTYSQTSGTITVNGDFDKFYPVTWYDGQWSNGKPSELYIGRPDVHTNSNWRGSLMSKFTFHTTNYGHGSHFIKAFIHYNVTPFIAGWRDATPVSSELRIIIWLRGGGTTYNYYSDVNVNPIIYDGVQNSLPFNEASGITHSYKTSIDPNVNSSGSSQSQNAYFGGNVGIGTTNPDSRLTVKGHIHAEEVRVDLNVPGPDYVFDEKYKLPSLIEVENYIKANKHLPEIPSAKEMQENGINLSEMNMLLLKKVEELTLYVIEVKKEVEQLQKENQDLKSKME